MRVDPPRWPRWLRLVTGVVAAWAIVAALVMVEIVPYTPTTTRGWVMLLVIGPPVYLAGDWAAGRFFNPEVGARISSARFSFRRILIALVVALTILVPVACWILPRAK